jgi:hypothetical protein
MRVGEAQLKKLPRRGGVSWVISYGSQDKYLISLFLLEPSYHPAICHFYLPPVLSQVFNHFLGWAIITPSLFAPCQTRTDQVSSPTVMKSYIIDFFQSDIIPIVGSLTFHTFAIIVAGAAAAVSSIIAAFLTLRHATHFSNPAEQKQ